MGKPGGKPHTCSNLLRWPTDASVMLAGGVSIKELAEYLGHGDPAFTLRVYAHMLPCSHDRARVVISERFTQMMGPGN